MKNDLNTLSDPFVRAIQLTNVLVVLLILFLSVYFGILAHSLMNALKILIFGLLIWSPIIYVYSRLFEVGIQNDKIVIRNLVKKVVLNKEDYIRIDYTYFPLVFKIRFKNNISYHFIIPMINIFLILFINRRKKAKQLDLLIKKNE